MKPLTLALALCTAAVLPLQAQQLVRPQTGEHGCFPELQGVWKAIPHQLDARTFGLSTAQAAILMANVHAVTSLLRAAPAVNPPLGVNAEVGEDMCCAFPCQLQKNCTTRPAFGRIWLRLHYYISASSGKPFTHSEEYADVLLWMNNPYEVFKSALMRTADGRSYAFQPIPWRTINGMAVYINQDERASRWMFITRKGSQLWLPVSREQYLRELIAQREKEYLKSSPEDTFELVRRGNEITRKMLIDPLKQELARMSPAERASQAWVRGANDPMPLVPPNTDMARPVVINNPDYFDLSRPRTDIQLIVVSFDIPWDRDPEEAAQAVAYKQPKTAREVGEARLWQLMNQVEWDRIAAMVR